MMGLKQTVFKTHIISLIFLFWWSILAGKNQKIDEYFDRSIPELSAGRKGAFQNHF